MMAARLYFLVEEDKKEAVVVECDWETMMIWAFHGSVSRLWSAPLAALNAG